LQIQLLKVSRPLLEDSNVSVRIDIPAQRVSVKPAPIPSSRIPMSFHQPTPTRLGVEQAPAVDRGPGLMTTACPRNVRAKPVAAIT
jgi:hypothetical protein